MEEKGLCCSVPIDSSSGSHHDLLRSAGRVLRRWIASGRVAYVHFGTPCTGWSQARGRPPDGSGAPTARLIVSFIRCCVRFGVRWTLENPASSRLWMWPGLRRLVAGAGVQSVTLDCREYGAHYIMPTRIIGTLPHLESLARRCQGGHAHDRLQGIVEVSSGCTSQRLWATSLAAAYPPALARAWAELAAAVDSWQSGSRGAPLARSSRRRPSAPASSRPLRNRRPEIMALVRLQMGRLFKMCRASAVARPKCFDRMSPCDAESGPSA